MKKLVLFISLVVIFLTSCEKSDTFTCFEPFEIRFDSILVNGLNGPPLWKTEKVYIPSAFTPNGDDINDVFSIATYLFDEQATYFCQAEIYDGNSIIRTQSGNPFTIDRLMSWDGRNANNEIVQGSYRLRILFIKNDNILIHQFHDFYLLLPNSAGQLPVQYECLSYNANFEERVGLIFEDGETYY